MNIPMDRREIKKGRPCGATAGSDSSEMIRKNVVLFPEDVEAIEKCRRHIHECDNDSSVIRRGLILLEQRVDEALEEEDALMKKIEERQSEDTGAWGF